MPEPIRSLAEVTVMLKLMRASLPEDDDWDRDICNAALATLAAVTPLLEDLQEADDQLRADGGGSGFSAACTDGDRATLDALLAPAAGEKEGG